MAPRRSHELAVVALAALSVAAALALGRVFDAAGFVAPVVGAALLPHALGALTRRRGWSVATTLLASAAGMVAYTIWVVDPGATTYGVPTAGTLEVFVDHLGDGYEELRTAVVPAPVTDGALVLAVLATWAMAQTADLLAFRRDACVAAVAPALAVFIWAATLGTPELRTRTTVGFAAAAVVFLWCQHQALLERHRAAFVGRRLGRGTGLVTAGIVAGIVAVLGGAVVGPALPGAESDGLVDVKGLGGGAEGDGSARSYQTDPPLATIGDNFREPEPREVFTVESEVAEYWRIAALDRYSSSDGGQWTLTAEGSDEVAEGLDETSVRSDAVRQVFRITGLGGRWMPAAYEAVLLRGADALVVTASTTLVSERDRVTGLEYTVRSAIPTVPDGRIEGGDDSPPPAGVAPYTELPSDFPADVSARAREIVAGAGATTPTERARALEAFFRSPDEGFTYDLDVDLSSRAQSQSAISEFLAPGNRRGFCVQFAGSYAAMARAVGLPARVAVGYTPGAPDPATGRFRVTTWDAHAWPEVFLVDRWVRFEPTPPGPGQPGGADLPGAGTGTTGGAGTTATAPGTVPATAPPSPPGEAPAPDAGPVADVSIDAPGSRDDRGLVAVSAVTVAIGAGVVIGLAAVAAVAVVVAKTRRRARRRARPEAVGAIAGAWEDTLERLSEAGMAAGSARTPLELAGDAGERVPVGAAAPLRLLAETYTAARYGLAPPDRADADRAWSMAIAVDDALAGDVSLWVRWRRRLDPTPLRR